MRELGEIDHFVAGAVGPPGHRAFHIEIDAGPGPEWYRCEKEQVGMLAAAALEILEGLDSPPVPPGPDLSEPGEPRFRIGRIAIGFDDDAARIELHPSDPESADPTAFSVTAAVLEAMARRAVLVVAAGRPPCPMCGLPRDADGHACPSSNGDLRGRS